MPAVDERPDRGRNRAASLRRGLALLSALGDPGSDPHGASLGDLAASVGIDKSSAVRLLMPMREVGMVEVDDRGRYRLGVGLLRLGQTYLERLDLRAIALPILRELTASTGETSHLVLYQHPDVVYIEKVESDSAVHMRSRVGRVEPAALTGVGRAYLAYAPRSVVDDVLSQGLPKRTTKSITSSRAWRAELKRSRERGFAIDDCQNEIDIRCVGAAILDRDGHPVAALSVAGPAWRLTIDRAEALGPVAAAAAAAISARLGAADRADSA